MSRSYFSYSKTISRDLVFQKRGQLIEIYSWWVVMTALRSYHHRWVVSMWTSEFPAYLAELLSLILVCVRGVNGIVARYYYLNLCSIFTISCTALGHSVVQQLTTIQWVQVPRLVNSSWYSTHMNTSNSRWYGSRDISLISSALLSASLQRWLQPIEN